MLEVIDRLDYRPNAVARGLASKKRQLLSVSSPILPMVISQRLPKGLMISLKCTSTILSLLIVMRTMTKGKFQVVNTLFSKQVDGIIFMGYYPD